VVRWSGLLHKTKLVIGWNNYTEIQRNAQPVTQPPGSEHLYHDLSFRRSSNARRLGDGHFIDM
jgi:hypothetical protein